MPAPRPTLRRILPAACLTLLVLLSYWPLTTMQGVVITDDFFTSDIMNNGFPERFSASRTLARGELPLWMTEIYGGFPLLARAEAGALSPPNLLLYGLFDPYVALNLSILATVLLTGLGMYCFTRQLGATWEGAFVAGISLAFAGFFVAHMKHLSMVNTACCLPWGLFCLERALSSSSRRWFVGLALVVGWQNLAGHIQISYYASLVYLTYLGWRGLSLRSRGRMPFRAIAGYGLLALFLGHGLGAAQILPTYELVSLSQREGGVAFEYATQYSYDPGNAVMFVAPYANGDAGDMTYRGDGIFWEDYGYVGVVTLLFALLGSVVGFRRGVVKYFLALSVLAYLIVLGPNTPVFKAAFWSIPGFRFFRFPNRCLLLVDAALCVLAAIGVSWLLCRISGRSWRRLLVGSAICALVAADLLFHQLRQNPIADLSRWRRPPATAARLEADSSHFRIYSPFATETHKAAFRRAGGWQGDLEPFVHQREFLQPSLNVLYGLSSADGYAQLTPHYVVDLWGDQHRPGLIHQTMTIRDQQIIAQPGYDKLLKLHNVKYLLAPWPVESRQLQELERKGPVYCYRNRGVLPRAWVVSEYHVLEDAKQRLAALTSETFDPAREVLLEQELDLPIAASASALATIEAIHSNEVVVNVKLSEPGILVLSDTFYPGWKAYANGVEVPVLKANHSQRAVALEPGVQRVVFRFESFAVRLGFGITLLALLALVVSIWVAGPTKSR